MKSIDTARKVARVWIHYGLDDRLIAAIQELATALNTDPEIALWVEVKRRAAACNHADDACSIVWAINNGTGQQSVWRSWMCKIHHYGGSGAESACPACKQAPKGGE